MAADNKKLLVINVLDPEQYTDCHIKNSINIPLTDLESYARSLDRDISIVVYCANFACTASKDAWRILHKMGFTNIWAYEGGIAEWYQGGLITEGVCNADYLKERIVKPKVKTEDIRSISVRELQEKMKEHELL